MEKNKYVSIVLVTMILLSTILTPQTIYAVSEITADESKETSQVESTEPVAEDIQNVVGTDEVNSAEVELAKPIIEEGEAAEDEKPTPEDEAVINAEPETIRNNSPPVEEEKTENTEESVIKTAPRDAVEQKDNLITSFKLLVTTKNGENIKIDNDANLELDLNDMNAVQLSYGITKPDNLDIVAGDTYTIKLPKIFGTQTTKDKEITIDGVTVASYTIADGELIITFNDKVNDYDKVEMHANVSGTFDTKIFETEKEVVVEVPYNEGDSFTAVIRAKQQEYEGEDKKIAGKPYVLDEEGNKQETNKNPTHIDWTVMANDSMKKYENATIVDALGDYLEIDKDSFIVYQLVRNYNNEIVERKPVDVVPTLTEHGFELNLGTIEDAYEIAYTTRITRPDGGGTHSINNSARIILDGKETNVKDSFEGTWSGDIPIITKNGSIQEGQPNIVDWEVEYNFGKEEIGTVSLTDELTQGKVLLETIEIYEVVTDTDGNIVSKSDTPTDIIPEVDKDGNVILPNLDAKGKAYLITFSSSVPFGLNEGIVNTISDNMGNKDDATVNVNTIPSGGKIGEQHVDENGLPYIEWTITMNTQKIDVPSINIKDVFDPVYLEFDVTDSKLFELKRDGKAANNFTIDEYIHEDGRTGFELKITEAGPHKYEFVYRTYYTTAGMQQKELANNAELVFDDGNGEGIDQSVDFSQTGPKAGIKKSGKYVLNQETGLQEIEWTIIFNDSRILLENPKIIDEFTSKNYNYIENSLKMTENDQTVADSDYIFNKTDNGFIININKNTNARYVITYRTTADDVKNEQQDNLATLNWQGGSEEAKASVGKRDPGIKKSGVVIVNVDGTKSINWTVAFNTNAHVIHNFKLTDTNEPATVDISNIKITKGKENTDATSDFNISDPENGVFTVSADQLEAAPYQLTYTTSLSPEEEQSAIKNTASIEYTGGNQKAEAAIKNPELSVSKKALRIDKTEKPNKIHWEIYANDNQTSQHVNLVNALLEDKIPTDQRLVADSIVVTRADGVELEKLVEITTNDNDFKITLPDGPYQYTISYQTEIVEYPSHNPNNINQYDNYTELTNQPGTKFEQTDDAEAWIDYFYDGTDNHSTKTGEQNPETENVDWTAVVNPLGLTINNAKIIDTLSGKSTNGKPANDNSTYVKDSLKLTDDKGIEISSNLYTLTFSENNRSFTIEFKENITTPIHLSYSTRLDKHLIGTYEVVNTIELLGGQEEKSIEKQKSETSSQQWFHGGGGSGRTVKFELTKQNSDGATLKGAEFKLESVNINNVSSPVAAEIVTNEKGVYISGDIRAGRYILTETNAPEGFKELEKPIYFMIGYAETGDGYIATLTNSDWKSAENADASAEGNKLMIVNKYQPVSATLEAIKLLEGNKSLEKEQFAFELADMNGEVLQTAKNDANGQIIFEKISYDKVGKYNYQIKEVEGNLSGVTYDLEPRNVTVTVANDKDGKLVATTSYGNDIPKFTNTYKAAPTSVAFKAEKILEGQQLAADKFIFELVDAEGKVVKTAKNNAAGKVDFGTVEYDTVGAYHYTIHEVNGKLGGVTYDSTEHEVVVTVTDDGNGQLAAVSTPNKDSIVFTNTYTAKPVSVVLEASKELNGLDLVDGQFSFELLDEIGEVIQTVKNNIEGQVIFDRITYNKVEKHTYTIREVKGNLGGVTYDPKEFKVEVNVMDEGNGQLAAISKYIDGPATFVNEYVPAPDSVVLEASKTLNGLDLVDGQFSFELLDETGEVIQTSKNNVNGQVLFDKITYDKVGKHTYTIREVKGTQNGITYDESKKIVVVDVVDNGNGNLKATAEYENGSATFKNEYVPAPDNVVIEAQKVLKGQDIAVNQFAFELVDAKGEVLRTATNNAVGQIIFDEITYDKVGKHIYTIREVKGVQGGVTYDSTEYEVVVTVTDDKEGNLQAKTVYSDEEVVFNNSYKANDGVATIKASKQLEGQNLRVDHFEFNLLDENEKVIQTATNNAKGQINFNKLTFTEPGKYVFFIEEVNNKLGGVTYDETRYTATVTVTDNAKGQLETTIEYNEEPIFTNQYVAAPANVDFSAKKILEGQKLVMDQFTFELVDTEGKVLQTVNNNAQGEVNFKAIKYEKVGEYTYTIREVQGDLGGVKYDKNEFKVNVTITDNGKGQLIAAKNEVNGPVVFTNVYTVAPDSVVLEASKVLNGQELRENQFEFELVDNVGKVIQTSKNNVEGQVIFDEITYDKVGKHTYTIREVKGSQGGVTYDDSEFKVDIIIKDDSKGNLVATAIYVDGPAVFNNTYESAPDSVVFEASKVLNGQELRDGQFEFELVDLTDKVIQTKTNNATGQVIFDKITYDEIGEYAYTIREVEGNQGGVTYDTNEFIVTVIVEDNSKGNLVATSNYTNGPANFTNEYIPASDSVVIAANKVLEGQDLVADQFAFELVNSDGKILQTVGNNAAGQVVFDEITYAEVGEHTYTVREVKGAQGGVVYDANEFKVDVTVTDNGKGQLIASSHYVDGPALFTNTYTPAPDSVVLEASKVLNGQELREDQFEFELVDSSDKIIQTSKNNVEGQVIFDEITYDEIGEYIYRIREVKGSQGGVTYDDSDFKIDVTVKDDGKGNLVATVNYVDGPAVFNNTYKSAPDSVVLEASKTLTGLELVNGQFSFELIDSTGKVIQIKNNNATGQVIFDEITYDEVGEYKYTLHEVQGNQEGVVYDKTEYTVIVEVVDDGEGKLVAAANFTNGPASFINRYVAPADPADPVTPVGPSDSADPSDPVDPAKPADPEQSVESADLKEGKLPQTGEAASYTGLAVLLLLVGVSLAYYEKKWAKRKMSK